MQNKKKKNINLLYAYLHWFEKSQERRIFIIRIKMNYDNHL